MKLVMLDYETPSRQFLIDTIEQKATRDQTQTNINLTLAHCRVYQPGRNGCDDFEPFRDEIQRVIVSAVNDKNLIVDKNMWGLTYAGDQSTEFHTHRNRGGYSAIYYLQADQNSGYLRFKDPDCKIQPTTNCLLIFKSNWHHAVLPNVSKQSKRISIAMEIN